VPVNHPPRIPASDEGAWTNMVGVMHHAGSMTPEGQNFAGVMFSPPDRSPKDPRQGGQDIQWGWRRVRPRPRRSPKVAATVVSPVLEAGIPTSTTGEAKDDKGRLASGRTAATLDDVDGGLTVMTKPELLVAEGVGLVEDKGTSLKGSTT